MEWLGNLISENATMIFSLLLTVILSFFARIIIKVFKLGATFSTSLASKQEFEQFKKEIRQDLRAYKEELLKHVMNSAFKIIDEKLKDLNGVQDMLTEIRTTEARWEEQMKQFDEKYADLKHIDYNLKQLNVRVERISSEMGNENNQIKRRD